MLRPVPLWTVLLAGIAGLAAGLFVNVAAPRRADPARVDAAGAAVVVEVDPEVGSAARFRREGGETEAAVYRFTFLRPADAAAARDATRKAAMGVYYQALGED